jgi:hypothetical protein
MIGKTPKEYYTVLNLIKELQQFGEKLEKMGDE